MLLVALRGALAFAGRLRLYGCGGGHGDADRSLAFLAAFALFALTTLVGTGGLSQARRLLAGRTRGLGPWLSGLPAALRVGAALGALAALARLLGRSGLLAALVLLLGILAALATALARLHAATLGLAFLGCLPPWPDCLPADAAFAAWAESVRGAWLSPACAAPPDTLVERRRRGLRAGCASAAFCSARSPLPRPRLLERPGLASSTPSAFLPPGT